MEILVVEAESGDADLLQSTLERIPDPSSIERTGTIASACVALQGRSFDVVLLDLNLPDSVGLETVRALRRANGSVPIVVMTGDDDEELARAAVTLGADDYLCKSRQRPRSILRAISYAIRHRRLALDGQIDEPRSTAEPIGRERFLIDLAAAIEHAEYTQSTGAMLAVAVDRFDEIGATLGQPGADLLLETLNRRITAALRRADLVFRVGDEFCVICDHLAKGHGRTLLDRKLAEERSAEQIADRVRRTLAAPIEVAGHSVAASLSVGVALFPADGESPAAIESKAREALDEARGRGHDQTRFFSEHSRERLRSYHDLQDQLETALQREQFEVFYQPRLVDANGAIHSIAAVLLWRHPEQGLVAAQKFMPFAREHNLAGRIEDLMLATVGDTIDQWRLVLESSRRVMVEISPSHFLDPGFPGHVSEVVASRGIDPALLEIGFNESVLLQDPGQSLENIHRLKDVGVRLSIADFGAGQSSLQSLTHLPIDSLNISTALTDRLGYQKTAALVRSIATLAHNLQMSVTASNVSGPTQAAELVAIGCDALQGDSLAAPMSGRQMAGYAAAVV
jgi:diguanylate cyclase (GGDEF)-like protein